VSVTTVAYLTTDIVGSRQLLARHPRAMRAALVQHDVLLRAAVEGHGGRVRAHLGDGLLAVFDQPAEAIAAAVHAQRALRAADWGPLPNLVVRMAVHTGRVASQAGRGSETAARQCTRLLAIGHGGQILLSEATAAVAGAQRPAGVSVQALGRHRLCDFTRRQHVFQLLHPSLPAEFPPLMSRWSDRWSRYAAGRALPGWRWLRRQHLRVLTHAHAHPIADAPLRGPSS
jgi:class 3 adenylate cyclase